MRNATSVLEEELRPDNAQGTIALERYIVVESNGAPGSSGNC